MRSPEEYAKKYRQNLIEAIKNLQRTEHSVFFNIINLSMSNENREIDEVFETGDEFHFELAHFENSKDINVNHLVQLLQDVTSTKDSIANINAIEYEDVEEDDSEEEEEEGSVITNEDVFAMTLEKKQRMLYELIDHILWVTWDPLGISDIDGSNSAYTFYCKDMYELKVNKASEEELCDFLHNAELNIAGISAAYENCKKVASIIYAL